MTVKRSKVCWYAVYECDNIAQADRYEFGPFASEDAARNFAMTWDNPTGDAVHFEERAAKESK